MGRFLYNFLLFGLCCIQCCYTTTVLINSTSLTTIQTYGDTVTSVTVSNCNIAGVLTVNSRSMEEINIIKEISGRL